MTRSSRGLFMFSGLVLAAAAGCGGGGGSGGSPPVGPTGAPFAAIPSRPLQSGDAFRYAGTTQQNFVYTAAAPSPASNTTYSVVQNVAVTGPTSFNGATNAFDFKTSETDTSPLQSIGITTDTFYGTSSSNYVTYGNATKDTNGESLSVAFAGPHIVDRLPEVAGDSWTNDAAATLQETSPGGQTSHRTYAADGSYLDTTNYPQGSLYATTPGTLTGTLTQNVDGSGSFVIAQNGSNVISAVSVGTPRPAAAGTPAVIPIVLTQAGSAPTEADVPSWYPSPLTLYAETDTNTGGSALPAACNVPSGIATTGNSIVQSVRRVDTILGTLETMKTTDYVIPNDGVACVTVADTLDFYYDYSGQSPGLPAVSNKPIETETVSTTLGLTNATVQGALRSGATSRAASFRVANARANLLALVEHEKTQHRQRLAAALARTLLERNGR